MASETVRRTRVVLKLSMRERAMLDACALREGCKVHDLLRYLIRDCAREGEQAARSA